MCGPGRAQSGYPAGVPCWVENVVPNLHAALGFYSRLFNWELAGPGEMPGDPPGEYYVARLKGRDVAGIGSQPAGAGPAAWTTYVRVDTVDQAAEAARRAGGSVLAAPVEAFPAGRLAVLADPAGAVFGVWEAADRQGAQLVNEPGAWAMSTLATTDAEGAKAFYGAVFGWLTEPFGPPGSEVALWRRPGYVGGEPRQPVPRDVVGAMAPLAGGGPSRWSVDFWIDDAAAAAENAAGLGGRVIVAPHDTPGFKNAVLADPDGAMFSVSQRLRRG